MSSETITIRKDTLWKYSTFLLLGILVIGALFVFAGEGVKVGKANQPSSRPDAPSQPSNIKVDTKNAPFLGDENAPVTIVEFSDYQCPFCRKFWVETLPLIKSEYIETGKVKFVYMDLPLESIHPGAIPAAEAAECVREQGGDKAYFEMHDKIFSEQNILDGGDPLTGPVSGTAQFGTTELKKWAKDLGYDIDNCLDSGKYNSDIQSDLEQAISAGGQGTPYFIINGNPLSGAQPFSVFKQVIDAELA